MPEEFEFFFDGRVVGYFEETEFPRKTGIYKYEPYRGPGHYNMSVSLRAGNKTQCSYDTAESKVYFPVADCPQYGVLELSDFQFFSK